MQHKLSIYNLYALQESDGTQYIWNTRSGSVVKLEPDVYSLLQHRQYDKPKIIELLPELSRQGIVVPETLDEFNEVYIHHKCAQWNSNIKSLSFVIAPTMACNYRCTYCFEEGVNDAYVMSKDTMQDILSFVRELIHKHKEVKEVSVSWFGGEPLLAYQNVIVPLSEELMRLCKENGIAYKSRITTNGYYLDEKTARELVELYRTISFQITFDGTQDSYCQRKRTSAEAYYRVKENVYNLAKTIEIAKSDAVVSIRINVDKNNIREAYTFVSELKSDSRYNKHIRIYLGRLRSEEQNEVFFDLEKFEAEERLFNDFVEERPKIKEPKCVWCRQHAMNSLCIGSHGEFYKCEHDFGVSERVVGDAKNGLYYNSFFVSYMNQPPAERCKKCILFPICLGGCPHARYFGQMEYSCEYTQKYLTELVRTFIENRKEASNGGN